MVRLRTQGDCGAYAIPLSRGKLYHESSPEGIRCSSPSSANKIDDFPEPVGPRMRLRAPRLKNRSPSIVKRNLRWDGVSETVSDVDSDELSQANTVLWNPITSGSTVEGRVWLDDFPLLTSAAYLSSSSVWSQSHLGLASPSFSECV